MISSDLLPTVATWWASVSWVELFGALTGLACVWLYGRESMWAWPLGIVNALLFMAMFFAARLYSDVILQTVFFVLSVHGWYCWLRGGPAKTALKIKRGIRPAELSILAAVTVVVAVTVGTYFARFTDAALPYWDAVILALSLTAQWLLNKKQLENWLVWTLVDAIAIGVYACRDLWLTSLLYVVFLVLAIRGFVVWRRTLGPVSAAVDALPS